MTTQYETESIKILECIEPLESDEWHHIEPDCPFKPEWFGDYIQQVLESFEDDCLELYAEKYDDYDYTQGTALMTYGNPTVVAEFYLEDKPYLEITVSSGNSKVTVSFNYEEVKGYPLVDTLYNLCIEKKQEGNLFKAYPR